MKFYQLITDFYCGYELIEDKNTFNKERFEKEIKEVTLIEGIRNRFKYIQEQNMSDANLNNIQIIRREK